MGGEHARRPKRNPLTAEEVAEIIALKKRRAHVRLHRFKRTRAYKLLNIFNIACFFIYLELLICFYGPCLFTEHQSRKLTVNYSEIFDEPGKQRVSDIEIEAAPSGAIYRFVVNEPREIPPDDVIFYTGEDYLLRKELKGVFEGEEESYRLFAATPVLFLAALVLVACFLGFFHNLNEYAYSLTAISVLNALTLLAILCY
jgi:hypothetical protein